MECIIVKSFHFLDHRETKCLNATSFLPLFDQLLTLFLSTVNHFSIILPMLLMIA